GTGTDVAIEAADLTLVRGDLRGAADAIRLSRRTLATIKGNLFWAFAYNVAALPLAAAGRLSPLVAGAAMAGSSVFVVSNSLRLRRFRATATGSDSPNSQAGGSPRLDINPVKAHDSDRFTTKGWEPKSSSEVFGISLLLKCHSRRSRPCVMAGATVRNCNAGVGWAPVFGAAFGTPGQR
ncbi:MAG TPA: hypothetical protein VGF00_12455, partial [Acidimicrobiia bacterium]